MTNHMITPRSMTLVPSVGWVFYKGSSVTSVEVHNDGTVTLGSAGDDGRFLVERVAPSTGLPLGTTTPITFDTVTISGSWIEPGESLAPDQGEEGQ